MAWQKITAEGNGAGLSTFEYENVSGAKLRITDYGARVMSLTVPDRAGHFDDVVVGFDTPAEYLKDNPYFGAIVGRVANRIARGGVTIGDRYYPLIRNDGACVLHGGPDGFDRRVWDSAIEGETLALTLRSPDGDQGLPGNLTLTVKYRFSEDNSLRIDYEAETDADTICNPTNHTYWNLGGQQTKTVLGHELRLAADAISDYEAGEGRIIPVADTPCDFRVATAIGARIASNDPRMRAVGGYDFNYILNRNSEQAELYDPYSGRVMTVSTDQVGMQFYAGCQLSDGFGKGRAIPRYAALCLEAQGYPFAPDAPQFPSVLLRRGQKYAQRTDYTFGVRDRV